MKKLSSKAVLHKNQKYWAIDFQYDSKLIAELKKLTGEERTKVEPEIDDGGLGIIYESIAATTLIKNLTFIDSLFPAN